MSSSWMNACPLGHGLLWWWRDAAVWRTAVQHGKSAIGELELELVQSHMTQEPILRGEVGACRFTQLTSTAPRQQIVQEVERPLNAKAGVPPSIGSSRC